MKRILKAWTAETWVILTPFLLFSPILLQLNSLYWGTAGLQFVPWRYLEWLAMRQQEFPLWNPFNGMGAPLIANYQSAFFYPPGWISFLFAWVGGVGWMAWSLTFIGVLHLSWAGLGMFQYMKKLGYGVLPRAISGLSFALCGYLVARIGFMGMIWTASWFPWVMLLSSDRPEQGGDNDTRHWKKFFNSPLILSVTFMLLSGHAQLSWYILLFSGAWVFVRVIYQKKSWNVLLSFAFSVILAACLSGIQLIPTAELLFHSQRASSVDYETALTYSFWPWRFITFFAPDFFGNPGQGNYWGYANYWEDAIYIGLLPLLLALSTFPKIWKANTKANISNNPRLLFVFLWTSVAVSFVLALGKNTPIFPFLYRNIPTFNMFNAPGRYMIWAVFSLSILAGVGAHYWNTPNGKRLYWLRLITAGGFAVTLGALLAWVFIGDVSPTFIKATAISGLWGLGAGLLTLFIPDEKKNKQYTLWQVLVVSLITCDLLFAGWVLNPGVTMKFYDRPLSSTTTLKNELNGARLYLSSLDEYQLKFLRFLRFRDFSPIEDRKLMRTAMLPNLNILDHIYTVNNFDPLISNRYSNWVTSLENLPVTAREPWLRMMNVGMVETLKLQSPEGISYDAIEPEGRIRWFDDCVQIANSPENALELTNRSLGTKGKIDSAIIETVINEVQKCSDQIQPSIELPHHFTVDKFNQLEMIVDVPENGWLVLADMHYPGWRAYINDIETEIFAANYLFRGIKVSEGRHVVRFVYRPISFFAGAGLSLFSILFMLLLTYCNNRKISNN